MGYPLHRKVGAQLLGALLIGTSAPALAQSATTPVAADNADIVPDIVVTARKREERLRDVPQSVAAVSGDALEMRQATSIADFAALIPGLNFTQTQRGSTTLIIRGANAGGSASSVAVYVDETPFGSSSGLANAAALAGDFDTSDLARVEVLRGPQGTLYGASSLGGLLKFVTNAPDPARLTVSGKAGIESVRDGDTGWFGTLVANIPLDDKVALRASGFYRHEPGFIDSNGKLGSLRLSDIDGADVYGGRAALLIKPTDDFSVRFSALLQDIRGRASSIYEADPTTFAPVDGRPSQTVFIPELNRTKYRLYNATAQWDLGFASLTSSTSYGTLEQLTRLDVTYAFADLLPLFLGDLGNRSLGAIQRNAMSQNKFTQEVRLASSSGGGFEWLLGAYYTDERANYQVVLLPFDRPTLRTATEFPLLYEVVLKSRYREFAGFANATIRLSKAFDVTFGGRVADNRQSADQNLQGVVPGGALTFDTTTSKETVFTYSVAPRLKVGPNSMFYARVAKGYRPGGPNVLAPGAPAATPRTYGADAITSYEAGVKADLFGKRVSVDLTGFYLDWTNVQLTSTLNGISFNANAGAARSLGAEATLTLRPAKGLTFVASGAYTDAKLTRDAPDGVGGFRGDRLPYTPRWSGTFDGQYEWNMDGDLHPFVGGTLSLVGGRLANYDPTYQSVFGRKLELRGYTRLDLRAGVKTGRFTVEAFVKNATNKRIDTSASNYGLYPDNALAVGIARPRSIGASVGFNY